MKFYVNVSAETVLRSGRGRPGRLEAEIDVEQLTQGERDELLRHKEWKGQASEACRITDYVLPVLDLDHLRSQIQDWIAKRIQQEQTKEQERLERTAATRRVLESRSTRTVTKCVYAYRDEEDHPHYSDYPCGAGRERGEDKFEYQEPDWNYDSDDAIKDSPEALAWQQELDAAKDIAMWKARARALASYDSAKGAERARQKEREAWIEVHGSEHLRRCLAEGIEHRKLYRRERLALERPDWQWAEDVPGDWSDPDNPPADAFTILDKARTIDPDATLAVWIIDHDCSPDCCDECISGEPPEYDWQGYVAVATFLGRDIVLGIPDCVSAFQ